MNLVDEAGERDTSGDEKRHAMPLRLLAEELSKEQKRGFKETGDQFDEYGYRQVGEPPAKLDIDAVHCSDHLRALVMRDQYGGAGGRGGQGCGDGHESTAYSGARDGRDNRRSGRPPCIGRVQVRPDNGRTIGSVCPRPRQAGQPQRGTDFVDRIPGYERQGLVRAGPSYSTSRRQERGRWSRRDPWHGYTGRDRVFSGQRASW